MRSVHRVMHPPCPRSGYSLIEMVTVIALLGVVILACGLMMHALLKIDRVSREADSLSQSMAELTHRFRRDVHRAESISCSEDRQELTLIHAATSSTLFRQRKDRVEVLQLATGEITSREVYHLRGCALAWEELPEQTGWRMTIRRPSTALTTPVPLDQSGIDFVIDAHSRRFRPAIAADAAVGEVR